MKAFEWEEHPDRLGFKEFVPYGRTLLKGGFMRMNHTSSDCSGESASLIIRKHEDGWITGYCHRCKRKGTFTKDAERQLPVKVGSMYYSKIAWKQPSDNQPLSLPTDLTVAWSHWPLEAKLFCKKARITETDCDTFEIGWSPSLNKVVLPLYQPTDKGKVLVGYQLRRVLQRDKGPKYLTRKSVKHYYKHFKTDSRVCCIVEDFLSGIRVGKYVSALCLYGTTLTPAMIMELSNYKTVVIFLDNDNNIVKKAQQTMKRELEVWCDHVVVIQSELQPKEYTDKDLSGLFERPF